MMKFIFQIKIKKGHSKRDYIKAWKKGSGLIQASKGALGTRLYQKISDPNSLFAIATWKSKKDRDVAMKKLRGSSLKVLRVLDEHKKHGATTILSNFEEIAYVNPKK